MSLSEPLEEGHKVILRGIKNWTNTYYKLAQKPPGNDWHYTRRKYSCISNEFSPYTENSDAALNVITVNGENFTFLGEDDYCSGFMDPFGKWNNGFSCPPTEQNTPVYCCGTETLKYCCVKPKVLVPQPITHLTLILGITFGVAIALAVLLFMFCFHCSCGLFYKKRHPPTRETVYPTHLSGNSPGVANMYSFSRITTPASTPRSLSRSSSLSRSRFTSESGHPLFSASHIEAGENQARHELFTHPAHNCSAISDSSHSGSISLSDRSGVTVSETGTVRENIQPFERERAPCNYLDPQIQHDSLLIKTRSSATSSHPPIPRPRTPPSLHLYSGHMEGAFPGSPTPDIGLESNNHLRTFMGTVERTRPQTEAAHIALSTSGQMPAPMQTLIPSTPTNLHGRSFQDQERHQRNQQKPWFETTPNHHSNSTLNFRFFNHFHDHFRLPSRTTSTPTHETLSCSTNFTAHNSLLNEPRLFSDTKF